ncbi:MULTISPECIES: FecR family protein [Methylosinus]|uniref:FecR family protein n=1 Tax=Methylosinus TaxID=425 RepID=UPI001FCA809D|nr:MULTISPECIES: FecR family protein [Methylosinus]
MARGKKDEAAREGEFVYDDPIVDEALEWFARLRDEPVDAATRAAFERWRSRGPRHAREYRELEAMWGSAAFQRATESLREGRQEARRGAPWRQARRLALGAAAVVMLVAGASLYPVSLSLWDADYSTETGDRRTVRLPDGSTMILDTASAVAIDFGRGRRQVKLLEGEAFFDVKHDPEHPFRVVGRFGEMQVRGTAFSVRAGDDADRVILERGRVDVGRLSRRDERVDLAPGEMVVATKDALSAVTRVDPGRELAWRDGRIIFENRPLSHVLKELRRYYKGAVFVMDHRIDRLLVTGDYRLEDIEGAIRTLTDAAGVTISRLPGGIIIIR